MRINSVNPSYYKPSFKADYARDKQTRVLLKEAIYEHPQAVLLLHRRLKEIPTQDTFSFSFNKEDNSFQIKNDVTGSVKSMPKNEDMDITKFVGKINDIFFYGTKNHQENKDFFRFETPPKTRVSDVFDEYYKRLYAKDPKFKEYEEKVFAYNEYQNKFEDPSKLRKIREKMADICIASGELAKFYQPEMAKEIETEIFG